MEKHPVKNPVKAVFNGIYVAVIAFTAFVLIAGAGRGARAHPGERPEPVKAADVDRAAARACLADLEKLDAELRERMDAVFSATPARRSSETEWETWSPQWRTRLMQVSARCRLDEHDAPESLPLIDAYQGLIRAHRLYTTLTVQFAQGIGPTIDQLNVSMDKAKKALAD